MGELDIVRLLDGETMSKEDEYKSRLAFLGLLLERLSTPTENLKQDASRRKRPHQQNLRVWACIDHKDPQAFLT
jgi:hypothetical protein